VAEALDFSTLHEDETGEYSGEASTFGLPPGSWPDVLEAPIDFGNGRSLLLSEVNANRAVYQQEYGSVRVTVWND